MIKIDNLKITPLILTMIAQIDEFKGTWKIMGTQEPQKLNSLKKVAAIESVGSSNRIEGNKLSDRQVEKILSRIDKKSFSSRDEQEVIGYAKLMELIFDDYELIPVNENHIKQMHRILLEYSKKDERHKGEYKKLPNNVAAYDSNGSEIGIVFETATPFDTPKEMKELVEWTNNGLNEKTLHPLLVIAIFVVNFLAIHPFQDGNGRLSRALSVLLLLKCGYYYVPYSSIEAIIEDNKEAYYKSLRATQTTGDYEAWVEFFLKTLQKQIVRLQYKLNAHESGESKNYKTLPELSARIMELFDKYDRLTVSTAVSETGANLNTVKKHLFSLVENNYIEKFGKTRGSWYIKKIKNTKF